MFQKYTDLLKNAIDAINVSEWDSAIELIARTYKEDRQVLICGNGGSASTASHFVVDWNKMTQHYSGKALRGICLADNVGLITAYANDHSYDLIFSEQVKMYGTKGDLLIIVSGSGNSQNVIKAIDTAHTLEMQTLAVVGFSGGKAALRAQHKAHVPSNDMQICEDIHLMFGHMVMKYLCGL
ncbi:SIS domain-containing protein [Planktomarina temperata]|nr:SIS domain-containing protein [Planktomarina temperata]